VGNEETEEARRMGNLMENMWVMEFEEGVVG